MTDDQIPITTQRDLPADLVQAIVREARAHYLRVRLLSDAEFMAGVKEGLEQAERGEGIPLQQVRRELGLD